MQGESLQEQPQRLPGKWEGILSHTGVGLKYQQADGPLSKYYAPPSLSWQNHYLLLE